MNDLKVGATKLLKKKISISIDVDVLDEFNKIASLNKYNKSKTITNLIRIFVENEKKIMNKK